VQGQGLGILWVAAFGALHRTALVWCASPTSMLITETNRTRFGPLGMQDRAFGIYLMLFVAGPCGR
jgi:hypothetical protein